MVNYEQKNGYSVIDRRTPEPCRVCGCPDECHSMEYAKPTMDCIRHLREQNSRAMTAAQDSIQLSAAAIVQLREGCELYCGWYDKGQPQMSGDAIAYELVSCVRSALATLKGECGKKDLKE